MRFLFLVSVLTNLEVMKWQGNIVDDIDTDLLISEASLSAQDIPPQALILLPLTGEVLLKALILLLLVLVLPALMDGFFLEALEVLLQVPDLLLQHLLAFLSEEELLFELLGQLL